VQLKIIVGPTCSGKSDLAVALAQKSNVDTVIINADSKQIYQELPILTNQPAEYGGVTHELFGHRSAYETYSVGQWLADVERVVEYHRGSRPEEHAPGARRSQGLPRSFTVVGGTGMYIDALLNGISDIPNDQELKMTLRARDFDEVRNELFARDTWARENLQPNDRHRIIRALEVLTLTGKSISLLLGARKPPSFLALFTTIEKLALVPPRDTLCLRADSRLLAMTQRGALQEVAALNDLPAHLPAAKTCGFPELLRFIRGETTLEEAIAAAQQSTRRYIKRQITWIRGQCSDFMHTN
jgi:tRNA dimethylallyltransferase